MSTQTVAERASRLTPAETFADTHVLTARQLRKVLRRPMYVVYLFVQPVIFVLLFRYVFGGAIDTGSISYVDYLRNPETAQPIAFIWVFPLVFASSAFVPADTMPGAVRAFADVNPVKLVVDAARALMIGEGGALGPALGTLAWLAGLLLVFVPLSVRALRNA